MAADALFAPFAFKGLKLPNRVVMAPMTRSFSPGGVATEDVAAYYARRAAAEVGLIVSGRHGCGKAGFAQRSEHSRASNGENELAAWKKVIDAVHAKGGLDGAAALARWRRAQPRQGLGAGRRLRQPLRLSSPGHRFGEPMSDAEVADAIAAFGRAAGDAARLGFDAVELHGAHGYLIDQFFWDGTNERADLFGGPAIGERPASPRDPEGRPRRGRSRLPCDHPAVAMRNSRISTSSWPRPRPRWKPGCSLWPTPAPTSSTARSAGSGNRSSRIGSQFRGAGPKKLTGAPTITVVRSA